MHDPVIDISEFDMQPVEEIGNRPGDFIATIVCSRCGTVLTKEWELLPNQLESEP